MSEKDAIDLSGATPAETAVIEILKLGREQGTGWFITLAGPAHPKTIAWADQAARRSLQRQAAMEAAQVNGRKYKPEEKTPESQRRENVAWVAARIIDWTPVNLGEGAIAFSEDAAIELLSRPEMGWAFAQLCEHLADERSFMRPSATP